MKVGVASSCRAYALVEPARLVVGLDRSVIAFAFFSVVRAVSCNRFCQRKTENRKLSKKKMSVQYKAVCVAGRSKQALDYSKDPPRSIRTLIIVTATAGFETVCQ